MKNIPHLYEQAIAYTDSRANRREGFLLQRFYPQVPKLARKCINRTRLSIATALHTEIPANEVQLRTRANQQTEQERKTIAGISMLKRYVMLSLPDHPLMNEDTSEKIDHTDGDAIEKMYIDTRLASSKPKLFEHLQITRHYAEMIGAQINNRLDTEVVDTPTLGAMSLLRNIAMFFDERGYHRKQLTSATICRELGISEEFIRNYLRPASVDAGPMPVSRYAQHEPAELDKMFEKRHKQVWETMTLKQKIVEFSGLLAKTNGEKLLSYEEIMEAIAKPTRSSARAYEASVQQPPLFFSARYASSTLSPAYEETVWIKAYERMKGEFEGMGVNREQLRTDIAKKFMLRTA